LGSTFSKNDASIKTAVETTQGFALNTKTSMVRFIDLLFNSTLKIPINTYILCINKGGVDLKSHVTKWGNSLGIRIPVSLAKEVGISEGTPVELHIENGTIIISRKKYCLETLLSMITTENVHNEFDTGPPVGREAW